MLLYKFKTYLLLFVGALALNPSYLWAQDPASAVLIGYVYESNNRGYLSEVNIRVYSEDGQQEYKAITNPQGKFELMLPIIDGNYTIEAQKTAFQKKTTTISTKGRRSNEGVYTKIELSRLPGYLLDLSLVDLVDPNQPNKPVYGVENARIEVYNNTLQKEVVNIPAHSGHIFQCYLEQGNEYIFLIRKEGYYAKRMRANVNVNGCILCMEGFGTVQSGVSENLTRENTMGTLTTSVPMKKMVLNEILSIENIYYDLGKATLRPETFGPLNKLAQMMQDNPQIVVELSSHTDSRGSAEKNMLLSQRRAQAVVNYINARTKLDSSRIRARGYGETRPLNSCVDGVSCSEAMYQKNRRTELMVIDILAKSPEKVPTLASMMYQQNLDLILEANDAGYVEGGNQGREYYQRKAPSVPNTIAANYEGYKIQLLEKKGHLSVQHFLFYEFDEVFLDVLTAKHYAFLIGNYPTAAAAQTALQTYKAQFPSAKVIRYEAGQRAATQ